MAEKQLDQENESKCDWHRFEYSEIGDETNATDDDPEQDEKLKELKKLEMFLRKPWCCK
jgi:hypothetical protein